MGARIQIWGRANRVAHTVPSDAVADSGITPFAIPSDVLDACALAGAMSAELGTICENERRYVDTGMDVVPQ